MKNRGFGGVAIKSLPSVIFGETKRAKSFILSETTILLMTTFSATKRETNWAVQSNTWEMLSLLRTLGTKSLLIAVEKRHCEMFAR